MSVGSVNTNNAAYVALQSLNNTSSALQATQKQISTGYRVADATDDGGAFAVAQKVRSDVGALTSVNQQLGTAKGLVTTALSSLTSISNTVTSAKALLVKIGDQSISADQRDQYVTSYLSLVKSVADSVDNSTYNGQTLLGSASGTVAATSKAVINNEAGATATLNAEDVSQLPNQLAALIGATFSRSSAGVDTVTDPASASDAQTAALASLQVGAGFDTAQTGVNNQLNQAGADSDYLDSQITFNSNKIDSLNSGLGALVDADLSKESAVLQSLQIKQQLGTQALGIANQSPQSLLSLFK
ncbi:flagellin [Acidisphaera sp. L21]|jgi:flagellin|uniref:flagellin N-terminal helical domain-containing protein n=1 Tax=Acidisphaera sp. L21 TaxID=1641851 RepID=UPI00131B1732|nr:flagellin [Acidisphaera sp. L21]